MEFLRNVFNHFIFEKRR